MDALTPMEWVAVLTLGISGSMVINYPFMARKHGMTIGTAFLGGGPINIFAFVAVISSIVFAIIFGKWWYALIIFFAGMSIGAGVLILVFRQYSQVLSFLGMVVGVLLLGNTLMDRIG